jgi:ABC-type nitrate/sulfonate/bicarbonate transport system ATPase subunit
VEEPGSGTIDVSRSVDGQKHTGMVFQEFALFPWRTVLENIVFGPEVRSVPKAQREAHAQKLIELVHLRGFEHATQMSCQRHAPAYFARALPMTRDFAFDEPLLHWMPQRARCCGASAWQGTKRTPIYATHGLDERSAR